MTTPLELVQAAHKFVRQQIDLGEHEFPCRRAPLDAFYDSIKDCQRCPLGKLRTHLVFGAGNPQADVMFIGEAPGREEDLQGKPFVGRAGQLLDKIIQAIQFTREQVYIANIL
ncbi:MAG: uracil-DNA glycosylase, partial [Candidatus Latescibacteria bacterium]|nr:uracil-DNA glycosylase [Candidatus Latescibacterota bacterium]